ncbi:hypothetical protein C1Y40_03159 [Mycobacterium talmoniae]|uniref:Uncharacterized protein n=1 Tax=Mycobacterium talmoniae TaxID=1858794 RepID=A0A2S8BJ07_9MYCO|nr:hypothetical protein [Mycobacterium eburneum]PQM46671.1 hypothetical protein C1Y40_03159 [Mycobacterium talmoniae]TDH49779.1 hypothetical protein E2F47_19760 [Mycobacterium eburneum]
MAGVARFVGKVPHADPGSVWAVMYPGDIELYRLDPPLRGYSMVAAAQSMWAMRVLLATDPPELADDPVCTHLFGITGGEGLQIEWGEELFRAGGRTPQRALAEAGYWLR